jgi:hypothetical protein
MRRAFLTGVIALAFVPAAAGTGASGLRGIVMRGPITPVCRAGEPCSAPAKFVTLRFLRAGSVAGRATTGADGRYRIRLAPGYYDVRSLATPRIGRGLEPVRVHVVAGVVRTQNFSIDTGIR